MTSFQLNVQDDMATPIVTSVQGEVALQRPVGPFGVPTLPMLRQVIEVGDQLVHICGVVNADPSWSLGDPQLPALQLSTTDLRRHPVEDHPG